MDDPSMSDETLAQTLDTIAVTLKCRGLQYESEQVAAGAARIRGLAAEVEDLSGTILEMGEQMDMQDID